MSLSLIEVFNGYVYTRRREVLDYNINLFNQAMQGCIQMTRGENHLGDFQDETFWKNKTMTRRRNAYADTAISSVEMEMGLRTTVKVDAGTPLVLWTPADMDRIKQDPEGQAAIAGEMAAEQAFDDALKVALLAYCSATAAQADVYTDIGAVIQSWETLMDLQQKFGDASNKIRAWAMNSKVAHDLFKENLGNSAGLFTWEGLVVQQDPFGRPIVITDIDSLVIAGSPNDYYTPGLVQGAITVHFNDDYRTEQLPVLGNEQIKFSSQSEWSFQLGLKGYTWDKTSGGASPNNAALGSSGNWDKVAASRKDLAGVLGRSL